MLSASVPLNVHQDFRSGTDTPHPIAHHSSGVIIAMMPQTYDQATHSLARVLALCTEHHPDMSHDDEHDLLIDLIDAVQALHAAGTAGDIPREWRPF